MWQQFRTRACAAGAAMPWCRCLRCAPVQGVLRGRVRFLLLFVQSLIDCACYGLRVAPPARKRFAVVPAAALSFLLLTVNLWSQLICCWLPGSRPCASRARSKCVRKSKEKVAQRQRGVRNPGCSVVGVGKRGAPGNSGMGALVWLSVRIHCQGPRQWHERAGPENLSLHSHSRAPTSPG